MELSVATLENLLESIAKKLNISKEDAKEYAKMPFDNQQEYLERLGKKFLTPTHFSQIDSGYTID